MTRSVLLRLYLLVLLAIATSGCELAAGIFKAGVWVGVLAVVVVLGLVFMLVRRSSS
jgi:hypothetical protein